MRKVHPVKFILFIMPVLFLYAGKVSSEDTIPDSIITYWAKHAIPLQEYVRLGYGMSEPKDAYSDEWCPQQPSPVSLLYANHPNCDRLLDEIQRLGRIK